MNTLPSTSLIVATYNWPEALELCLFSCINQSIKATEIIVADDGSKPPTKEVIEKISSLSQIPIVHAWHEDQGFRLAGIRNKAIGMAKSAYIIQVDGDLILHKDFIKDHLEVAGKNQFVSGSRTLINKATSVKLLSSPVKSTAYQFFGFFKLRKKYYAIRSKWLFKLVKLLQGNSNKFLYVLGANMAFWKADLLLVNGYNENITGWGKEDNEIAVRLINAGKNLLLVKNLCIVYHLHHVEAVRESLAINEALLQKAIDEKIVSIEKGIVNK